MKRQNKSVLTIVALLAAALLAPAMAQESSRPATLMDRLGSLRLGWRDSQNSATDAGQAATGSPQQQLTTASQKEGPVARVASRSQSVPRVNPLNLLPKDFQGPSTDTRANASSLAPGRVDLGALLPSSKGGTNSAQTLGSARARIYRDLRQDGDKTIADELVNAGPNSVASPERPFGLVAKGAPTRAGSVLSDAAQAITSDANSSGTGQLRERILRQELGTDFQRHVTPKKKLLSQAEIENKKNVGKSIAAEVARRMSVQVEPTNTTAASELQEDPFAEIAEELEAEQPAVAKAAAKPATNTEQVVAKAETDSQPVAQQSPLNNELTVAGTKPPTSIATPNLPVAKTEVLAAAPVRDSAPTEAAPTEVLPSPLSAPATTLRAAATPASPVTTPASTVTSPFSPAASQTAMAAGPSSSKPTPVPTRIALESGGPVELGGKATSLPLADTMAAGPAAGQAQIKSSFGGNLRAKTPNSSLSATPIRNNLSPQLGDRVLVSQASPQLMARVLGPRHVTIGREADFQVRMFNKGTAEAKGVEARIQVPEWAEVARVTTSSGRVDSPTLTSAGRLLWRVDRFAAGDEATMDLSLVARSGRPIELSVDWTHAPVMSRTLVEVQEPQLKMHIVGPDEVFYGKPQVFRLTLSNPGTGVAEQVSLLLAPPGKSIHEASRHVVGNLAPGGSKTIEIELTAREAGQLALLAQATATGGVHTDIDKQVFCRKPEIEVDWRGPTEKYANTLSTYYFRVRNGGTAPAEAVTFNVILPPGFEMVSASDGQQYDRSRRSLSWRVGSLRPGDDYYMELKGVPKTAGNNDFQVTATTDDQLITDSLNAVTSVIAVADLKLDVRDPKGPLPVGTDAVYEVRVKNRGSNVAEAIDVVALFSGGIEPQSVEGHQCDISDGRVALPRIKRLPVGGEVVLRIHAKAVEAGTHIFRAEVACIDLEMRLAAEEMTRFYADDSNGLGTTRSAGAASRFNTPR